MDEEDIFIKLDELEEKVYDMNGKIVIDSLTGKPLLKFIKTGYKEKIDLNDPDFALKQLAKLNKNKYVITCSKCHHCR